MGFRGRPSLKDVRQKPTLLFPFATTGGQELDELKCVLWWRERGHRLVPRRNEPERFIV